MKVSFKRSSLSADFFFFASFMIIALILVSLGFWVEVYHDELKKKQNQLPKISDRIGAVLIDSMDYTAKYAEFIGQRIAQHNPKDLAYIAETISGKSITQTHEQNLYTTTFDWVTPDNQLRASSKIGVLPKPLDMSDRDYLAKTPLFPWTFQLSAPRLGGLSKQWIIPAGMGITNKKGDFLGTITLGFSINGMVHRIDQMIDPGETHYLVLTDAMQVIIDSTSDNSGPQDNFFPPLTEANVNESKNTHFFATPIRYHDVNFSYYKKVDKSPYVILVGYTKSMEANLFNEIVLSRMAEFTGIGFAALLLLYLMRRRLVKPVMELAENAQHIIKGSDIHIKDSNIHEIAILGRYLQKVADYVQNEHRISEELRYKTQQLEQTASELEAANAEALTACEAARRADRIKSEFLANMSHELRTPMNAVIGLTNILLKKEYPPEKRNEYLRVMQTSAHHLLQLINDLLDIARLESNKTQLENVPFSLSEVLEDVIAINTIQAAQKNIELNLHIRSKPPVLLMGDPSRLRQILINLIGNAVKFTEKGYVKLEAECKEHTTAGSWNVRIIVSDTGIGILPDKLDSIFDKFTQADSSIRRTHGGTGLGLSISKTLVEMMKGTISVESTYGKGSRFIIELPLAAAESGALQVHTGFTETKHRIAANEP